jgi:hypothetical protein
MIDEMKRPPLPNNSMNNSSHYGEFQAEPQEILKSRRHESGTASRDVGFERALADWLIKHRSNWRKSREPGTQLGTISIS